MPLRLANPTAMKAPASAGAFVYPASGVYHAQRPRPAELPIRAPVAQWIERRPPEPKVAGSNPVRRASNSVSEGIMGAVRTAAPMRRRGDPSVSLTAAQTHDAAMEEEH